MILAKMFVRKIDWMTFIFQNNSKNICNVIVYDIYYNVNLRLTIINFELLSLKQIFLFVSIVNVTIRPDLLFDSLNMTHIV